MDKRIELRIPKELKERFEKIIVEKGYNKSAVIRLMIEKWIEQEGAD